MSKPQTSDRWLVVHNGPNRHARRILVREQKRIDRIKRKYPKPVPGAFGIGKPEEEQD